MACMAITPVDWQVFHGCLQFDPFYDSAAFAARSSKCFTFEEISMAGLSIGKGGRRTIQALPFLWTSVTISFSPTIQHHLKRFRVRFQICVKYSLVVNRISFRSYGSIDARRCRDQHQISATFCLLLHDGRIFLERCYDSAPAYSNAHFR